MSEFNPIPYKRAILAQQTSVTDLSAEWNDPFSGQQLIPSPKPPSWNKKLLLALAAVGIVHFSVWYIAKQLPTPPLKQKAPTPVVIEIIKPEPPKPKEKPPEVIKPKIPPVTQKPKIPPVVEKPQPVKKVVEQPKPVPKAAPTPQPTPKVVEQPVSKAVENVKTVPVPEPTPAPKPVAKPVEQNLPVTEAKGYAGYLSNPAPEYPEVALDRGWEGSVMLRVKVSPTGSPLSVDVKQGSGKKILDDAAVRTVKSWKFSPALRGSTPVEGWVDVPIHYQLPR
ncbi:MAG: energy transducer TonB [Acinetobacter sp.]|uniref:energy transducer TonB n=1 Tax=Acinetobacter sp. TaxID=472 RepID=UPI00258D174E|nr:energy transducer TonB [Acinetobacter sp.]MCE1270667.1 energy transducer TonB [Acinetobacter sp.]